MRFSLVRFVAPFFVAASLEAFPSSLFWTVCTTDVQDTGVMHSELDNYFDLFSTEKRRRFLPPDIGFTLGLFDYTFKGEIGFDFIGGAKDPFYFNGKIGLEEGLLFSWAPAFSTGIYYAGTANHKNQFDLWQGTTLNVWHAEIGKTLPAWIGARVFAGLYHGSKHLRYNQNGWMVGLEKRFLPTKDCEGTEFHRLAINIDYASGKNAVGGGGIGLYYYFTPLINVLVGPTFFNDATIYGKWKLAVLVNIDFPITKRGLETTRKTGETQSS